MVRTGLIAMARGSEGIEVPLAARANDPDRTSEPPVGGEGARREQEDVDAAE
jgi:hypothetical protein